MTTFVQLNIYTRIVTRRENQSARHGACQGRHAMVCGPMVRECSAKLNMSFVYMSLNICYIASYKIYHMVILSKLIQKDRSVLPQHSFSRQSILHVTMLQCYNHVQSTKPVGVQYYNTVRKRELIS